MSGEVTFAWSFMVWTRRWILQSLPCKAHCLFHNSTSAETPSGLVSSLNPSGPCNC